MVCDELESTLRELECLRKLCIVGCAEVASVLIALQCPLHFSGSNCHPMKSRNKYTSWPRKVSPLPRSEWC